MNFRLEELEFNVEDHLVEQAETFIENGFTTPPVEIDRHLWLAQIDLDPSYEVEIQITPSKIKAWTCECPTFLSQKKCSHVVAGTILLRKKLANLKSLKTKLKKEKATKTSSKLTTTLILDKIPPKSLHTFLRAYAKENRTFALALKARFANMVDISEDQDKYLQLLDASINAVKRPALRIGKKGIRQIEKVSNELINHAEEAIILKNYQEAIAIIRAIFNKLFFILAKVDDKNPILAILEINLDLLIKVIEQDIAPFLQESLWEELLSIGFRENIHKTTLVVGLQNTLLKVAKKDQEKEQQLLAHVQHFLSDSKNISSPLIPFLLTEINLLQRLDQNEAVEKLIQENLNHPDILFQAIDFSKSIGDHQRIKLLAKTGLKIQKDSAVINRIHIVLLESAILDKKKKTIKESALTLFINTYDFKYYKILKENATRSWAKVRTQILAQLDQGTFSIEKRNTIAAIYKEEGLHGELLDYLKKSQSLDLLTTYDHLLIQQYSTEISDLYETLLTTYLKTHIGRQPSIKVKQILDHLKTINKNDFAKKLANKFRDQFANRHSLMEELAVF